MKNVEMNFSIWVEEKIAKSLVNYDKTNPPTT